LGNPPIPAGQVLRPVLDMYMRSAVAVTGCHAEGLQRNSCELDVLIVGPEKRQPTTARIGGVYMDLVFIDEKEALRPSSPELAAALAHLKPVRDATMVISTSSAAANAVYSESCRKASSGRLAAAVKHLGRSADSLTKGNPREADFWLLVASYHYAYAWLYADEVLPAPSHLLRQLKEHSKGNPAYLGAFSRGAALGKSSRPACNARAEALSVLYDFVGSKQLVTSRNRPPLLPARLSVVKAKANELLGTVELAECYSYLGQEVAGGMLALMGLTDKETKATNRALGIGPIFEGEGRLLSDRLLKDLGLTRGKAAIEAGCQELKDQVNSLAKRL
jgi:hypothetical protein